MAQHDQKLPWRHYPAGEWATPRKATSAWQQCPICNGTGQQNLSDCPVCNGQRIISTLTGKPPTP